MSTITEEKKQKNPMESGVSDERYEFLNTPGSLDLLAVRISNSNPEISYDDVIRYFPKFCIEKLKPASIDACRMYFLQRQSIIQIAAMYNTAFARIENRLKRAEEMLINYLKTKKEEK